MKPVKRKPPARKPDRVFRALADQTRLRILHLLLRGELCVCDIVKVLGCPQPTASRHLAYLRKAGLVAVRRAGVWCYYQLAPAVSSFDAAWQECIEECRALPRFAQDAERLAATQNDGCS